MELLKLPYLKAQTAVGGAFGLVIYFLSDEWWVLALGVMTGATLAFFRARYTLGNLDLPADATFREYAEAITKNRAKGP